MLSDGVALNSTRARASHGVNVEDHWLDVNLNTYVRCVRFGG